LDSGPCQPDIVPTVARTVPDAVITAADSKHSSFGCQDKVKWTYFGDVCPA
jgi:hypothetical protein